MIAITNCSVVTPAGVLHDSIVLIDNELIVDYGPAGNIRLPERCEEIDAYGRYVGPGFIDIHCHGGGGVSWLENPARFAAAHLRHGTTGLLSTTGMYKDLDDLCAGIDRTAVAMRDGSAPNIIGIQMEGPYKNPKYGAQPELSIEIHKPDYEKILRHGKEIIRIWTIAPELDGMEEFVRDVTRYGHILSVGHSEATAEQIYRFIPAGLKLACHCMDATGISPSLKGSGGTREVGVDEAVLVEDRIYAEVIPDAAGLHVRPLMVNLIVKTKGVDRVIVITDGTADSGVRGLAPGETDVNYNERGLCGSLLTMDAAARNMKHHTGLTIQEIFTMTSLNPARLLGIDHSVGSVERWKTANLVLVDEEFAVDRVFLNGKAVSM